MDYLKFSEFAKGDEKRFEGNGGSSFMKERSNIQQPWHGVVNIERDGSRYIIRDLMVRWNEQTEEKETEDGTEIEYVYEAHRIDVELPPEVQPGIEAVELYLEAAQVAILQLAQDLEAQEAGFA